MNVRAVKTALVTADTKSIVDVVVESVPSLAEQTVLCISAKIVSLCEGSVVSLDVDREQLIKREADKYLDPKHSSYGHHFTIKNNTLIGSAGIDQSNSDGAYVLWPQNPQQTANKLRAELSAHYKRANLGILIVDSTSTPLRRGASGIAIAHSGFAALNSNNGQEDLFGRVMQYSVSNVAQGLAAAAVVAMGEGSEQTPLAVIEDASFVTFTPHDPTTEELATLYPDIDDDLFQPFLSAVDWD